MPFHTTDGVRHFSFDIFPVGLVHAVFTRQGGLSPDPWNSLNVGSTVGDEQERVLEIASVRFVPWGATHTRSSTSGRCTAQMWSLPMRRIFPVRRNSRPMPF